MNDSLDDDVVSRAVPVIETMIRRRCRNWRLPADVHDDLRREAIVRLLKRVCDPDLEPLDSLDDYVAGLTSSLIEDLVRTVSPAWAQLAQRVRYALHHDGLKTRAAARLAQTMNEIQRDGKDRTLDELVREVAARTGVKDPIFVRTDTPPLLHAAESAKSLPQLWSEIAALPLRQRIALLLHAHDANDDSILHRLVGARVVTMRELAAITEMEIVEFARLWNDLPLLDADIAERLRITRQQVIHLRKAARDRLARRTGWFPLNQQRSRRESIADVLGVERAEHPSYEMLEQYLDGTAEDVTREIVDSHREVCPNCDAEVRGLMSFSGRTPRPMLLRWLGW